MSTEPEDRCMTESGQDALDLVRRRVINVVGHELRTPLTTIRGLAELLSSASEEELHETLIPALVRNARRAEILLDDLLIAGEVVTATPTDPAEKVDLESVVAEVADGLEVQVHGAPDGPVRAHREQVTHALSRLVENATRYSEDRPSIAYESAEGQIAVVVRSPVTTEIPDLQLCFELFFRGEAAVTRAAGLGVGLPVARALARFDGGDVTIDQVGDVVESRLTLPRAS